MRALIASGAGRARANIVQAAGKVKGRLQGLTGGLCKEPTTSFRFAVPRVTAIVRNAPRLE